VHGHTLLSERFMLKLKTCTVCEEWNPSLVFSNGSIGLLLTCDGKGDGKDDLRAPPHPASSKESPHAKSCQCPSAVVPVSARSSLPGLPDAHSSFRRCHAHVKRQLGKSQPRPLCGASVSAGMGSLGTDQPIHLLAQSPAADWKSPRLPPPRSVSVPRPHQGRWAAEADFRCNPPAGTWRLTAYSVRRAMF
jgi:hypothetical protein